MTIRFFMTAVLTLCCAFALALPESAEAARLGGGRSFGGKPFMSTPAPRSQVPGQQSPGLNQAQPQQQAAAAARPGGLFGGMGGMFGGLLAGTLLGSLLSGHGFSGGGFMDILIFGLLIYFGLKLLGRLRGGQAPAGAGAAGGQYGSASDAGAGMRRDAMGGMGWEGLRTQPAEGAPAHAGAQIPMPEDFDADSFLRGAKMAYSRLQSAWDRRDLDDIAQFATEAVQEDVHRQMRADPTPGTTELLLVNAHLLGVENEGDRQYAQVLFDVLLRESPDQQTPSGVREVWHFVRPAADGNWKLDGIQQVA